MPYIETLQPVGTTAQTSVDATATLSLRNESFEALTGVATTVTLPIDATGIVATAVEQIDGLRRLRTLVTVQIDATGSVATAVEHVEALQRIQTVSATTTGSGYGSGGYGASGYGTSLSGDDITVELLSRIASAKAVQIDTTYIGTLVSRAVAVTIETRRAHPVVFPDSLPGRVATSERVRVA